jgi:hypothetical protein
MAAATGTTFVYNSGASYLLSTIVSRLTFPRLCPFIRASRPNGWRQSMPEAHPQGPPT